MTAGLHKNGGERGVWFDRDLQLDTAEHSRIINASNQQYLSALYSDSRVIVLICARHNLSHCAQAMCWERFKNRFELRLASFLLLERHVYVNSYKQCKCFIFSFSPLYLLSSILSSLIHVFWRSQLSFEEQHSSASVTGFRKHRELPRVQFRTRYINCLTTAASCFSTRSPAHSMTCR